MSATIDRYRKLAKEVKILEDSREGREEFDKYKHFRESQVFDIPPGWSVLEALRASGIRHASVCGGRGRCRRRSAR